MKTVAKPTVEDILAITDRCEDFYRERNRQFAEDERFYELEFAADLQLPDEFATMGIVLPTGRDMVDAYTNHVDLNDARVFVNRKGTYKASDEHNEKLRKFYHGLIYMTNVMSSISPWRVGGKHHGAHGLAVFKDVWDADRWAGKPDRKQDESENNYAARIDEWRATSHNSLPIVIQAVNPYNIYPDPAFGGELYVIEKHERLVYDAVRIWPRWGNTDGKKATDTCTFISYWDKNWRCDIVDGEPVLKVKGGVAPHNYGFVPYVLIDAGLGNVGINALPEQRYVGILRYIKNLLISESRDYSIADIILSKTAWPWGYIKGADKNLVTSIKPRFGTYLPLPDGVEIKEMYPQVPPDALQQHMAISAGYIAAHAAPRVSQGLSESGVRSSADRRLVLGEAALRYQYSSEAFAFGTARVMMNCARIFKDVLPGDVNVWAKTPTDEFDIELSPKDIKEPFTCYIEFAPFSEEDEYRRHDDLERLVQTGLVTPKWARTQMSNVDAVAMDIEEEIQRLRMDPQLQAVTAQIAFQMMQAAIAKRGMAMEVNNPAAAQPGAPQQPGRQPAPQPGQPAPAGQMAPPTPNMPPPGSAGQMQNALANLRSQTPVHPMQGHGGGGAQR